MTTILKTRVLEIRGLRIRRWRTRVKCLDRSPDERVKQVKSWAGEKEREEKYMDGERKK
jgi:hypothetical protein